MRENEGEIEDIYTEILISKKSTSNSKLTISKWCEVTIMTSANSKHELRNLKN